MHELLLSKKASGSIGDKDGVPGVGSTWNPNWPGNLTTYSEGNLRVEIGGNHGTGSLNTIESGQKRYFEVVVQSWTGRWGPIIGIIPPGGWYGTAGAINIWIREGTGITVFLGSGPEQAYGQPLTIGDVIGCQVDLINKLVAFYKNGVSLGATPFTADLPVYHAAVHSAGAAYGVVAKANFGALPFM